MVKPFVFFVALLVLASLSATMIFSSPQEVKTPTNEIATPVHAGVKSNKEKIKGKLFERHKTGRNLREETATGSGELVIKSIVYPPFVKGSSLCPAYPSQVLTSYAQEADAIIIGSVLEKSFSQLTEGDDFVFSEYSITVEEILKNNPLNAIAVNSKVSVVRPGGKVKLNGREVHAIAGAFVPFEVKARYLLFLKFIPETGDYHAFGSGTFLLQDGKALGQTRKGQEIGDAASFINEVRGAVSTPPCATHPLY